MLRTKLSLYTLRNMPRQAPYSALPSRPSPYSSSKPHANANPGGSTNGKSSRNGRPSSSNSQDVDQAGNGDKQTKGNKKDGTAHRDPSGGSSAALPAGNGNAAAGPSRVKQEVPNNGTASGSVAEMEIDELEEGEISDDPPEPAQTPSSIATINFENPLIEAWFTSPQPMKPAVEDDDEGYGLEKTMKRVREWRRRFVALTEKGHPEFMSYILKQEVYEEDVHSKLGLFTREWASYPVIKWFIHYCINIDTYPIPPPFDFLQKGAMQWMCRICFRPYKKRTARESCHGTINK